MRNLVNMCLVLVVLILLGCGRENNESSLSSISRPIKGPKIQFRNVVYNFGECFEGEKSKLSHTFEFKNVGTADLEILQVKGNCTCLAAVPTKQRYQPGEIGAIKVSLSPHGRAGIQEARVLVTTNDCQSPTTTLLVRGYILRRIHVKPRQLNFGTLKPRECRKRILRVWTGEGGESITRITASCANQRVGIQLQESRPDRQLEKRAKRLWEITVALLGAREPGYVTNMVVIRTNSALVPEIQIPLVAKFSGWVEVQPRSIFLGSVKYGKRIRRKGRIWHTQNKPFRVLSIKSQNQGASLRIDSNNIASKYQFTAEFDSSYWDVSSKRISGDFVLYTDLEYSPEIRISYLGILTSN